MKVPQGVKFPLRIEWLVGDYAREKRSDTTEGVSRVACASVYDQSGQRILRKMPHDEYGMGQDEIDTLEFIVEAANLMASKQNSASWLVMRESIQEFVSPLLLEEQAETERKKRFWLEKNRKTAAQCDIGSIDDPPPEFKIKSTVTGRMTCDRVGDPYLEDAHGSHGQG